MYINIDTSSAVNEGYLESSLGDTRAVISIIRDTLKDAKDGGHPDPKEVWADIAATLGIKIGE